LVREIFKIYNFRIHFYGQNGHFENWKGARTNCRNGIMGMGEVKAKNHLLNNPLMNCNLLYKLTWKDFSIRNYYIKHGSLHKMSTKQLLSCEKGFNCWRFI